MNWGLLILYFMASFELLYASNKHGKPRPNYDFWATLVAVIINLVLIWWATGWKFA
jgi:hypothetical protein